MDNKLTTKNFWESFWRGGETKEIKIEPVKSIPFSSLFKKHIPKSNKKALEIGCFPGALLAYISKTFGYFPEGIDFVENIHEVCSKTLKINGLNEYKIYHEDFTKWEPKSKYGLVCSFGFIEHFDNPEEIMKKHIDLLEEGGKLVVEVPNFNGLRHFIARYTDKKTLEKHNMKVMDLDFYKKFAKKYNLKINYLGPYGKFEYTWGNYHPTILQKLIYYPFKILSKLTFSYPFKNKLLSSWILFIAEKQG